MTAFELFDQEGDTGLMVVGLTVDNTFRQEADAAGRPDERLLTVVPEYSETQADRVAHAAGSLVVTGPLRYTA